MYDPRFANFHMRLLLAIIHTHTDRNRHQYYELFINSLRQNDPSFHMAKTSKLLDRTSSEKGRGTKKTCTKAKEVIHYRFFVISAANADSDALAE